MAPATALAQNADAVRWHEDWPRVGAVEIVVTELLLAGALVLERAEPAPLRTGAAALDLDRDARASLRFEAATDRQLAADASDVLLASLVAWPIALDGLVVAGIGHSSSDVFAQSSLVAMESFAVSWATVNAAKLAVGRGRPPGECAGAPARGDCASARRFTSYPSGHAALAFTGAGLVCVSHRHLPLYGGSALDPAACGLALGLAATTSVLRVAADRHWVTDVAGGAVIGLASGFVLPSLAHYRSRAPNENGAEVSAALRRPTAFVGHAGSF